ncbi:MAG: PKD domain-containing protein [Myxococcota bacterium]|nr:PKD domain-containing protein [Deltaproteobacteria bacterium]MDQ3333772.1 PKD domain-containing protein [Myxococcota bacterium]
MACAGDSPGEGEEATGETEQGLSTASASIVSAVESAQHNLGGFNIDGIEPATLTVFHLHVNTKARWVGGITTDLSWDPAKVRQGQTLDVSRTSSATGTMKVLWTLTGTLRPLNLFDVDIGEIPIAVDLASCNPVLHHDAGTPEEILCTATSPGISLVPGILPFEPYVELAIDIHFKAKRDAAKTTRTLLLGDEQGAQGELAINDGSQNDPLAMPCNKPAGTELEYVMDPFEWTPVSVSAKQQPKFSIGIWLPSNPITIYPLIKSPSIADLPFGDFPAIDVPMSLTGAGGSASLGTLQANNVTPTASAGSFSGQEGSPVQFAVTTTSACPITGYRWEFSNGTQSFGPNPQRTFGDDGVFDGQVTVTDMTNLSGTDSFDVTIANKAPVADAGPNTSGAWGTQITLNGQAVDPGTDDQATLTYEWNFGDGTPGTGGKNVAHAYAAPGDFTATLTVCDDHVCDTDSTLVHVRKRTVSVSYTGLNVGTFSAQATLAGSIVDELGQPVVNGSLAFNLAAADAGSANTNAAGNAARTIDVTLGAGTYPVGVSFAGNGFYDGGASGELFAVSRIATALSYTGSLVGGPNKTVNLSTKLVDALDRPLAGKLVSFQLGTQSASATTDANGIATASLKLAQKNGQYQLTTSYAGNASQWTSASSSVNYTIGNPK